MYSVYKMFAALLAASQAAYIISMPCLRCIQFSQPLHHTYFFRASVNYSQRMSKIIYNFKGLMAPVFTAFNDDKQKTINFDHINEYAQYLKINHIHGVLVNGTSGEGMCLTVAERKKTAEHWQAACKRSDLSHMLQIGGAPISDVIDLAIHAEQLGVDAILCLPDLYFKPRTELDLVDYFKQISAHCPRTPLLYYHIPALTGINLNIPLFLDLAEKAMPNFVGLKYTSGDLEVGAACLRPPNRSVFLGSDTILCAALALGFDSSIMTTLSICPSLSVEIVAAMAAGRLAEAQQLQAKLTKVVREILKNGDWVKDMKREFNACTKLNAGPTRKPALGLN